MFTQHNLTQYILTQRQLVLFKQQFSKQIMNIEWLTFLPQYISSYFSWVAPNNTTPEPSVAEWIVINESSKWFNDSLIKTGNAAWFVPKCFWANQLTKWFNESPICFVPESISVFEGVNELFKDRHLSPPTGELLYKWIIL